MNTMLMESSVASSIVRRGSGSQSPGSRTEPHPPYEEVRCGELPSNTSFEAEAVLKASGNSNALNVEPAWPPATAQLSWDCRKSWPA